jgi:hypothetical protein
MHLLLGRQPSRGVSRARHTRCTATCATHTHWYPRYAFSRLPFHTHREVYRGGWPPSLGGVSRASSSQCTSTCSTPACPQGMHLLGLPPTTYAAHTPQCNHCVNTPKTPKTESPTGPVTQCPYSPPSSLKPMRPPPGSWAQTVCLTHTHWSPRYGPPLLAAGTASSKLILFLGSQVQNMLDPLPLIPNVSSQPPPCFKPACSSQSPL